MAQRNAVAGAPPAKARSVILCYMSGGVSHLDSFDPKPRLRDFAGQEMPVKVERTQFNNNGKVFPSPFEFRPCGRSGIPVSDIFLASAPVPTIWPWSVP